VDGHIGALGREGARARRADPSGSPGDEHALSLEPSVDAA
jgi:hypothetical protein